MTKRRAFGWMSAGLLTLLSGLLMGQGCGVTPPPPEPTPTPTEKIYVGAATCQQCHSRHFTMWSGTNHAKAMADLQAAGQDTNPSCVACHTVGFGNQGGFVDMATTPELANVQCENCHGPGGQHVANVDDASLRPPRDISGEVCGQCHTGAHHPTFDEWKASGHGTVVEDVAASFTQGTSLSSCGPCHSGDYREKVIVEGVTPPDTLLKGLTTEQMNAVTCVICHDPHQKTGNDVAGDPGEDFQLRFIEATDPTPTNSLATITTPDVDTLVFSRYNVCGQCHHSRTTTWTSTSRPPHHSVQSNMLIGEMPIPDGTQPLLANERSTHRFVPKQCPTCHMPTHESESSETPAASGHTFMPDFTTCASAGCHPTNDAAVAATNALKAEVQAGLANIAARLGAPATWEYTANGGPTAAKAPYSVKNPPNVNNYPCPAGTDPALCARLDQIRQIRFLYYWVVNDLSNGVHNPPYTRAIIAEAQRRLTLIGE